MPKELKVGTAVAKRGELQKGIIKGVELNTTTSIDIPVLVMNGKTDGPTLLLVSTQHGVEIQGIEVIHKVMREKVNPSQLRGAIISIPVENPLAFMHHQYLSWIDNLDLGGGGSASPLTADHPDGNATERLAYALQQEAWSKADLVIIDDLMFMAINQNEANLFFHLINDLYNNASIILTSNKAPKEWGELLGDPAITTAILDRILHRAEIIHLNGDSYRMKYRSTIFS